MRCKHGLCRCRLYRCWSDMKNRCNSTNNKFYHRYGGRGIEVCEEWKNNFLCFYEWAMKNGYSDNLSLDGINNDGNYEPNNCRWSSQHEQSMNKKHLKSKTGYVGVKKRGETFVSEAVRYGRYYYIGTFKTAEDANIKRLLFLKEQFGEGGK